MKHQSAKQRKLLLQKEDDISSILNEKEKSLLLSLGEEIISCRTKEDIQNIISTKLSKYLEEMNKDKFRLEQENFYLKEQIKTSYDHSEVIGSNNGLKKIFQLVSNVASSDSTVLIMGETGSGKE
jgi:transcriptional regulator with GAF, ATPase, and Fis domain